MKLQQFPKYWERYRHTCTGDISNSNRHVQRKTSPYHTVIKIPTIANKKRILKAAKKNANLHTEVNT
jgi:hypothetical protein